MCIRDSSKTGAKRLMLHARKIEFTDNTEKIIVTSENDYGLTDFKKSI